MCTAANDAMCRTEIACIEVSEHSSAANVGFPFAQCHPMITPEVNLDYISQCHRTPFVIKIGVLSWKD